MKRNGYLGLSLMITATLLSAGCMTLGGDPMFRGGKVQGDWWLHETSMTPAGSVESTGVKVTGDRIEDWRLIERIAFYKGGNCWGIFAGGGGKDSFTGTWTTKRNKITVKAADDEFAGIYGVSKKKGALTLKTTKSVGGAAFNVTLTMMREGSHKDR